MIWHKAVAEDMAVTQPFLLNLFQKKIIVSWRKEDLLFIVTAIIYMINMIRLKIHKHILPVKLKQ